MSELAVYDRKGNQVGTYEIDPADVAPSINKQLLHDAVVMYQANARIGSRKTKTRSEVSGSTKKLYRQKGTGNARMGSRRSGVRRGGGHIHAIRPKDFWYRLPRKALRSATKMAIASKIQDDEIVVIDELSFEEPKTKAMADILAALGLSGASILVTTKNQDVNVHKSARNIERVTTSPVSDLNALRVLKPRKMLVTRAALDSIKGFASQSETIAKQDDD